MFEPLYEFDDDGHWDPANPIGIKFWCVEVQFLEHEVLHHLNSDGSLNAMHLLLDAIYFRKKRGDMENAERQDAAILLQFLRREKITIPHDEVTAILSTSRRH